MAKVIEHDHQIGQDGWDLDEKGQLVFDIIHSDGTAEGDARVINRQKSTWLASKLTDDLIWDSIVEAAKNRILKLVISQLGAAVRNKHELSLAFKGNNNDIWWFTAEQIRVFNHQPWVKALEAYEKRCMEEKEAKKRARREEKMQEAKEVDEDDEKIQLRKEVNELKSEVERWRKADVERQKKVTEVARAAEAKRLIKLEEREAVLVKDRDRLKRDREEFEAEKEAWEKNKSARVEESEVKMNEG